jgi:hypothetical protein
MGESFISSPETQFISGTTSRSGDLNTDTDQTPDGTLLPGIVDGHGLPIRCISQGRETERVASQNRGAALGAGMRVFLLPPPMEL